MIPFELSNHTLIFNDVVFKLSFKLCYFNYHLKYLYFVCRDWSNCTRRMASLLQKWQRTVGPAEVLEEELPLPFELWDVVMVVKLADPCIIGWGRIGGNDRFPLEWLLGFSFPLDHELNLSLPLELAFPIVRGLLAFVWFAFALAFAFTLGFAFVEAGVGGGRAIVYQISPRSLRLNYSASLRRGPTELFDLEPWDKKPGSGIPELRARIF